MDYNWLEQTPQVSQGWRGALPIWQPDYSFLQSMDMRINQQYDQGLQKIASSYSLFNQPTTGAEAASTQRDMARDAQSKLSAISSADLSDPKNVQVAENILAPFWENTDLLTNIAKTKQISNNLQKAYSVRDSTDDKIRDQFDDRYVELLQYQRNNLANAKLSDNRNVEVSDWIPFKKADGALDAAQKEDKFAVTQSFVTGDGRIVTTTNGASSLPAFKTYADSKIGSEYDAQYNLLGKLSKERQIAQLQQIHPDWDRSQAQRAIGEDLHPQILSSLSSRTKEYGDLIGMNQAQLDKINAEVNRQPGQQPTATQQYNIDRLTKEIDQYTNRKSDLEQQFKSLQGEAGIKAVSSHPEVWLGQNYRNDDINKWALGESGKSSMKYETDQAFWSSQTLKKDYYDIGQRTRHERVMEGIDAAKIGIEQYNAQTGRMEAQGKYPWMFDAAGRPIQGGVGGWRYGANATTQEQHIDPINEANLKKESLHNDAVNEMWGPGGMSDILRNIPGTIASPEEIITFTREMNNALHGGKISAENADSYNKIAGFLHNQTGMPATNPNEVNSAMLNYINKYINDNTLNGGMGEREKAQLRKSYSTIKDNIAAYTKDDLQREAYAKQKLSDKNSTINKKYISYTDQNGNTVPVTPELINKAAPYPEIEAIDQDGNSRTFTPLQLAQLHIQGKVGGETMGNNGEIKIDGKNYNITRMDNQTYIPSHHLKGWAVGQGYTDEDKKTYYDAGWDFRRRISGTDKDPYNTTSIQVAPGSTRALFGLSSDFKTNYDNLMKSVIPQTDLYKKNTGVLGPQIIIDDRNANAPLTQALLEDVLPGQYNEMYDRTKGEKDHYLSPTEKSLVQEALHGDKDITQYIGVQHIFYPKSFTGKPGVEITFNHMSSTDEKKNPDMAKMSGRKIFIEQSDTHGATYNKLYPSSPDYSYDPLVNGKSEKSDPIMNTINHCSYELIPSQGVVTAVVNVKTMDANTGKESMDTRWINIPLTDEDPDKIRKTLNDSTAAFGAIYDKNLELYNHNQHK